MTTIEKVREALKEINRHANDGENLGATHIIRTISKEALTSLTHLQAQLEAGELLSKRIAETLESIENSNNLRREHKRLRSALEAYQSRREM